MKTERNADILGFKFYYDLATGDMRNTGSNFMDWMFTIVLITNYAYRKLAWRLFFVMVPLKMNIHPNPGEELKDMYLKMAELIEERKNGEDNN